VQDGVPYTLPAIHTISRSGWYWMAPLSYGVVASGPSVNPGDIRDYLNALERFLCIVCLPTGDSSALVVPFDIHDAASRGWAGGRPLEVFLIDETVAPMDFVWCRRQADVLLYDQMDLAHHDTRVTGGGPNTANARAIVDANATEPVPSLDDVEARMRWHLSFVGASLSDWSEIREGYEITWMHDGVEFTAQFNDALGLRRAPICLAGTDGQQNLSSVVEVMQRARELQRYDLGEEYYI